MDIAGWLRELGLEQYGPAFRENDIDCEVLRSLTAEDLRELGIASIGHRRRLLDAIKALPADGAPISAAPRIETGAERRQLTVMFAIWPARPRFPPVSIRRICARCSAPITPPLLRRSPSSTAMSPIYGRRCLDLFRLSASSRETLTGRAGGSGLPSASQS